MRRIAGRISLTHYKFYCVLKDSLFSKEQKKELTRNELNYEFDKKEAVGNAEHKKEMESQQLIADEKSRKQNVIMFSVISCLLIVVFYFPH